MSLPNQEKKVIEESTIKINHLIPNNPLINFFIQKGIIQNITYDCQPPDKYIFLKYNVHKLIKTTTKQIEYDHTPNKKEKIGGGGEAITITTTEKYKESKIEKNIETNKNDMKGVPLQYLKNLPSSSVLSSNQSTSSTSSLSIYSINKSDNNMFLDELIRGVGTAIINSKASIDAISIEKRRQTYEKDDLLKMLPLSTFNISNVEISLKFAAESIEKDEEKGERVIINTKIQDLSTASSAISEIKFTLNQKSLQQYKINNETILKEQ